MEVNDKSKQPIDDLESPDMSLALNARNFKDLPICPETLKGLTEADYNQPTKVQRQTLIHSLMGKDVVAASKTGSGKSLAFIIPLLELLHKERWSNDDGVGALVITPTRELAYQLYELINIVGKHHDLSAGLVIGGKDLKYEWSIVGMCNIIIGTPGRIMQHVTENSIFRMDNLQMLVLDEADECLSMGFEKSMKVILGSLPKSRQTLLFSATQTKNLDSLIRAGCRNAVMCFTHLKSKSITPKRLVEGFFVCKQEQKIVFLWTFIKEHSMEKLLVFVSTCKQVRFMAEVFRQLDRKINILMLHGSMNQLRRMSVYDEFCHKDNAVMIATDVAARGLDFPGVHWVVQLDCPASATVYIHRVGRTARFDDIGRSVLIVTPTQKEPMLAEFSEHNIRINEIEAYPTAFLNIDQRIESIVAACIDLQQQAKRTFFCYLKAVSKAKREFCDLPDINFDAFARSLGLSSTPDVGFFNSKIMSIKKFREINIEKNIDENEMNNSAVEHQKEASPVAVVDCMEHDMMSTAHEPMSSPVSVKVIPCKNKSTVVTKYSITNSPHQKRHKPNSTKVFGDGESETELQEPTFPHCGGVDYSGSMNKWKDEDKIDRKCQPTKQKGNKDRKRKRLMNQE